MKSGIHFNGIRWTNTNTAFLLLSNDHEDSIEIPIEKQIADRIWKYLGKISKPVQELSTSDDKDQIAE